MRGRREARAVRTPAGIGGAGAGCRVSMGSLTLKQRERLGEVEGRGATVLPQQAVAWGAVWALPVQGQDGSTENRVTETDRRAGVKSMACKLDLGEVAVLSFFFKLTAS